MKSSYIFKYLLIFILLIVVDQLLVYYIYKFKNYLVVINDGIIFGSIENIITTIIFLLIGLCILIYLFAKSSSDNVIYLVLIASGAVSNIIDRFIYGGVVDYIHFMQITTFNLADIFIILGLLVYFYKYFIFNKSNKKSEI